MVISSRVLVSAIPVNKFLTVVKNQRKIKVKVYENCVTKNFVRQHQNLNDNCFTAISSNSTIYNNSFSLKTIDDWNQFADTLHPTLETFKKSLKP